MSFTNLLILFVSAPVGALCIFVVGRSFETLQDIYFGITTSRRESFASTIKHTLLFSSAMYFVVITFLVLVEPQETLTVIDLAFLLIPFVLVIPFALFNVYMGYFYTGIFRSWIIKKMEDKQHKS